MAELRFDRVENLQKKLVRIEVFLNNLKVCQVSDSCCNTVISFKSNYNKKVDIRRIVGKGGYLQHEELIPEIKEIIIHFITNPSLLNSNITINHGKVDKFIQENIKQNG